MDNINNPSEMDASAMDKDFSFLEFLITLARRKKLVLISTVVCAALAAAFAFSKPNVFKATTVFLQPQSQQSNASLLSQLTGLSGGSAAALAGGLRNPADLHIGMLKSRTIAEGLVTQFKLIEAFGVKTTLQARNILQSHTEITSLKGGLIEVSVVYENPKLAADLANGYLDEYSKLSARIAITEASQRRLFFETQLKVARENLAKAETDAKHALAGKGMSSIDTQGRALAETSARIRGEIAAQEVKIASMRNYAAAQHPDLVRAQNELAALKAEAAKLEGSEGGMDVKPTSQSGLESLRLLREFKYYEAVYGALAQQYEQARLDEAKEGFSVQVLDRAIVPERKSGPPRLMIMIGGAFAGLLLGILMVFLVEKRDSAMQQTETQDRMRRLRDEFRWKS